MVVKLTKENKTAARQVPQSPLAWQRVVWAANPVTRQADNLIAPQQVPWKAVKQKETGPTPGPEINSGAQVCGSWDRKKQQVGEKLAESVLPSSLLMY